MKVINLFAGPGAGKSTLAAGLFYEMKRVNYNVELVTEFAKDLVWEERNKALKNQVYILGEQVHRLERLRGVVDYVVTDSPIILGQIYNQEPSRYFDDFSLELFNTFDNINVWVERSDYGYGVIGRIHNFEEACEIDDQIDRMLDRHDIYRVCVDRTIKPEKLISVVETFSMLERAAKEAKDGTESDNPPQ